MQNVSPWPSSFDVSEPVARVVVDGQEVPVESVTISSELDTALPEVVAAGGGSVVAATGTASLLPRAEVSDSGLNPWGDAQALVGASEVVVEAGYRDPVTGEVGCARQITAQVDSLSGGALSQGVGMDFVDYATALDRDITIEPLLQQYPHSEDGSLLGAGLSALYVTNRIVRHCGFYSTPPMLSQAVVSVPLFGSGVPERGELVSGTGSAGSPRLPSFEGSGVSWGLALSDGVLSYTPSIGSRGHTRLTSTLHVSFLRNIASASSSESSGIDLRWDENSNNSLHVQVNTSGSVYVRYRDQGASSTVLFMGASLAADAEVFTVLVTPSGQVTIHASNGQTVTATRPLPSAVTAQNMEEVQVRVPVNGPRLGGVQVAFSTTQNHQFQPTAHFPSSIYTAMSAFPAQINQNCLDLLKDQAEAELTAMWIDEFGHFQWLSRTRLRGSTPRGTLTSQHDLLDLQWSLPVRSVFSRVDVEYDASRITRRLLPSVTVADSGGSRLSGGDTEHRFFEPPADEDWHAVEAPRWLGSSGEVDLFQLRRGRGSYRGGVIVDEGDNEGRMAYSSNLVSTWEQIHPQKWLLTSTAQGLHGTEFIEQRFLDRPDWYGNFAGKSVPIIRARGLVQWETEMLRGETRGPGSAPVFTHRTGPWVQHPGLLQGLADFLTEELTKPGVMLREVPIVPDPRIQLGDTFWLEDQSAYHVRLRVVVMGKTLTYETTNDGVEMSQRITCKIIDGQRLKTTYQELADAWEPLTYDDLQAAWAGRDYTALEADPLDRS